MKLLPTKPNRWRPKTVFNLLVGLLFSLSAVAQPAFLKEGLVAYYPFNGNANDESGNGYVGNMISSSLTTDRFFVANSAVNFKSDVNSKIELTGTGFLNLGDSFAVSMWAKFNKGWTYHSEDLIYTLGGKPNWSGWSITVDNNSFTDPNGDITLMWQVFNNGSSSYLNKVKVGFQKLRVWNHFVGVKSVEGISLFLNGAKIDQTPSGITPPSRLVTIGGSANPVSGANDRDVDDVRIYNRALSDGEVKALYDYESTPQPLNPRIATATAQFVNGFVVGATITDGGYGYDSNPVVTITGGAGTGAKATALQVDGVVTSITITNPGSGYTSAPTITIAPPPFPPRKATSTAQVVNGFVVGAKITDGGFGYDTAPAVLILGGGGSGAVAVATVANGVVTAITITNPGTGYTSVPIVRIASPPFAPKLGIETSKVYVRMSVVLGRKYQLEASTDLNTWTTTGPAFIAQDEELAQEFDVNQVGRYFRINQVP